MEAVWKSVPGLEGLYKVSDSGNVLNVRSGEILRPFVTNTGYMSVHLRVAKQTHNMLVHRLVALAFLPNIDGLPQVNHINGIRTDNRLCNLEWCSVSQNIRHSFETGNSEHRRESARQRMQVIGLRNAPKNRERMRVLGKENARPIWQYDTTGDFIQEYPSLLVAQQVTGARSISNAASGKSKSSGGFHWRYAL